MTADWSVAMLILDKQVTERSRDNIFSVKSGCALGSSSGPRTRSEDGCGAVLQGWRSAAGEVRLCVTLLPAHRINSADVPSPEIS